MLDLDLSLEAGATFAPLSTTTDVIPAAGTTYFAQDGATYPVYPASVWPSAFYDASANKTWRSWEGWSLPGLTRMHRVTVFDHATGLWAGPYTASKDTMVDDDHGVPCIVMDHQGYVHSFGGAHDIKQIEHAHTTTARDPRFWTQDSAIAYGSYPHAQLVGSTLYLTHRSSANIDGSAEWLWMRKTSALNNGVATFAAGQKLASMGNYLGSTTRFYQGAPLTIGTDIHIIGTTADNGDTIRFDLFYLIYDTTTGTIYNVDRSVSVATASQPIAKATMDASFRIRDQLGSSKQGQIGSLELLPNGDVMCMYIDGVGDSGTYNVNVFTISGGVVGSNTTIGTTTTPNLALQRESWRAQYTLAVDPVTQHIRAIWNDGRQSATLTTAVFDGSSWSTPSTLFTQERTNKLTGPYRVKGGKSSHLFGFTETSGDSADEQQLRCYAMAFNGTLIKRTTGQTFTPQWPTAPVFTDSGTDLAFSTPIASNTVTIAGLAETAPFTVSGTGGSSFQWKVNGGSWQTGLGFVSNGDTLQLGATTAAAQQAGQITVEFGNWGGQTAQWTWSTVVSASSAETVISTVETRAGSSISNASGQRDALKTMIQGMIDDGDWDTFDFVEIMALPAQAHALKDFKGTHDCTITGSLTFTADRGFTGGDATTNYIQGTYNPTSHAVNYAQNSAGLMYWDRAGVAAGSSSNAIVMGTTGPVATLGVTSTNAQASKFNYNNATARIFGTSTAANAAGSRSITRTGATTITFYKDGAADGAKTTASTGIPNATIALQQGDQQPIIAIVGAGWSATAVGRIRSRISTWKTAIGA